MTHRFKEKKIVCDCLLSGMWKIKIHIGIITGWLILSIITFIFHLYFILENSPINNEKLCQRIHRETCIITVTCVQSKSLREILFPRGLWQSFFF